MSGEVRDLVEDDREAAHALGVLAFGGIPGQPAAVWRPGERRAGLFEDGRLVAKATTRELGQWWGGRPVPMAGVAGVAVHPDARGRGAVRRLLEHLLVGARAPVSVLFPTAPGIYRPLGFEVAGVLTATDLPTAAIRQPPQPGVVLRSAGPGDEPAVRALWDAAGAATPGLLTRKGPRAPRGLPTGDVLTLAEQDGAVTGYLAYDRGLGYDAAARLQVLELVAGTQPAFAALLGSLARWDAVAPTLRWWGPTERLGWHLPGRLPPPAESRPWMLRVLDAPAAVAARGFAEAVTVDAAFFLLDPDTPGHEGPWRLQVAAGRGVLVRAGGRPPALDRRGLALLYAGTAGTAALLRAGLLEARVPGLDAAFAGPAPQLTDYF